MTSRPVQSATVLIVEDDPGIRELERVRLEDAGYQTATAATAGDALRELGAGGVDLVLLDYRLPGGVDGLELFARVRSAGYEVPVILVTGFGNEATVIQALRVGVRDFVAKTTDYLDYLPAAVARVLRQVETERRLAESEARLAGVIRSAKDAVIVVEADRRVSLFNPAAEAMFGCPAAAALGRRVTDFIPDELAESGGGPDPGSPTHRLRAGSRGVRADGSMFPVEATVSPGRVAGRKFYTLVVRDVTERRRVEDALTLFRALIDRVTDTIEVIDPATGRYLDVNEAACLAHGYSRAEYLALGVGDIDPRVGARPWGELMADRARRGGLVFESLHRRKDGTTFPVEVSLTFASLDREYLLAVARDITAQKRAEQQFRNVLEAAPDAIVIVNPEGRIERVNQQAEVIFGYGRDELVGGAIEMLLPERYRDRHVGHRRAFSAAPHLRRMGAGLDLYGRRKDGGEFPVEISLSPLETGDGLMAVAAVRDVTERKRLEEQFRHAQRIDAIGQLAGGVAHDFNNLLTIINGYSDLLLEKLPAGDADRELLGEIRAAGERSASLTRQLLMFGRKQVAAPRLVDVNALVCDAAKMLRRMIGEDVRLETALRAAGRVRADPGQLDQVLLNLVVNARDAMPGGGRVTIETADVELDDGYARGHADARAGGYVLLAVSDTGCGMPPHLKARLFEPFFTTKEVGKGTGLGLAVVHGVVKQAGGHVQVYSEVGVGTAFKVYLPRVDEASGPGSAGGAARPVPRGTETILLVEDEDTVRALTRLILAKGGYTVLEAGGADVALGLARSHPGPIHLMVTDVVMPGVGGPGLAARVAVLRPEARVLYLSGYTDDAVIRHGILHDRVDFLQKPFAPAALAAKVREVLDRT